MTQKLDILITDYYLISTTKVGDMYQKYVDDKMFPSKPNNSYNLVLTTNMLAKYDIETKKVEYSNKNNIEKILQENNGDIKQIVSEHIIDSPYQLYQFIEKFNAIKDQYFSATAEWLISEKDRKPVHNELYFSKN